MYLDDDKKNECFRVYKSVEESYVDHSEFLTKYNRYAFLFEYETDDYKSWAKGLKKAGYATNPKYPQLLIKLIEDMGLDKYDAYSKPEIRRKSKIIKDKKRKTKAKEINEVEIPASVVAQKSNVHEVKIHAKGVKYVVAKKGDTFYKISSEFGLKLSQLYRYNSFSEGKDVLKAGDVIYIQPKRRRKIFKKEVITLTRALSLVDVSQSNATNLKSLKRLNKISDSNETFAEGERVTLR
jgi:LysM repeat protein